MSLAFFSTLHRINAAYLIYRRVSGKLKEKNARKPTMGVILRTPPTAGASGHTRDSPGSGSEKKSRPTLNFVEHSWRLGSPAPKIAAPSTIWRELFSMQTLVEQIVY
ncbi:MAG: hypothetical protein ACRDA8_09540, partial [Shewanella sp.]